MTRENKTFQQRYEELKDRLDEYKVFNAKPFALISKLQQLKAEIESKGCGRGTSNINYDLFCEDDWRCSTCQALTKKIEGLIE